MRTIVKVIKGTWQNEGVGARVIRSVGSQGFSRCDPFLMLDEFHSKTKAGGFPAHPHRGFETLTYMIEGEFEHEDFMGNRGKITPGDYQYMTAGRGVVHSEQPRTDVARGLQLWINLPAAKKMVAPNYQDQLAANIPEATAGDAKIKVIAGSFGDINSKVYTQTPMLFFDVHLNGSVDIPIRNDFNGFIYILSGKLSIGGIVYEPHNTLVLEKGPNDSNTVHLSVQSIEEARFVVIAGVPINEPIAQRGPFVMNTQEELAQAIEDFHECKNGFEKAKGFVAAIDQK